MTPNRVPGIGENQNNQNSNTNSNADLWQHLNPALHPEMLAMAGATSPQETQVAQTAPEQTAQGWESLAQLSGMSGMPGEAGQSYETVMAEAENPGGVVNVASVPNMNEALAGFATEEVVEDDTRPGYEGLNAWRKRVERQNPRGIWQEYAAEWKDYIDGQAPDPSWNEERLARVKAEDYNAMGEMPNLEDLNAAGEEFFAENFHDLENPISEEAKRTRIAMATKAALNRIGAQKVMDEQRALRTGVPPLRTRGDDLMKQAVMDTRSILDQMYNRNGYLRAEMSGDKLGEDEEIAWKLASEPQKVGNVRSWILVTENPRRKGETPADYEARLRNYVRPSVDFNQQKAEDEKFAQQHPELLREKWVIDWENPKDSGMRREQEASAAEAGVAEEDSDTVEPAMDTVRAERTTKEKGLWSRLRERLGFKKLIDKVVGVFEKKDTRERSPELVALTEAGLAAARRRDEELQTRKDMPISPEKLEEMAAQMAAQRAAQNAEMQNLRTEVEIASDMVQGKGIFAPNYGMEAPDVARERKTAGEAESDTSERRGKRSIKEIEALIQANQAKIEKFKIYAAEVEKRIVPGGENNERWIQTLDTIENEVLRLKAENIELEQEKMDRPEHTLGELGDDKLRGMFALENLRTKGLFEGPYNAEGYENLMAMRDQIEENLLDAARQAKHAEVMLENFETGAAVTDPAFNYQTYRETVEMAPIWRGRYQSQLEMIRPALRELQRLTLQDGDLPPTPQGDQDGEAQTA